MCIRDSHWPWVGPEDEEISRTVTNLKHRDGGNLETYHKMLRSLDDNVGKLLKACLLYTSDAADERSSVDLGGRRIIKKKNTTTLVHRSIHKM